MKINQPNPTNRFVSKTLSRIQTIPSIPHRALALLLAVALGLLLPAALKAAVTTNLWLGAGSDSQWSTVANWSTGAAADLNCFAVLTNLDATGFPATGLPGTNGMGAVGTPNITVTAKTTVGQLAFCNSNISSQVASYHTIGISPGVSLTVSNIGSALNGAYGNMILPVMSCAGYDTLFGGNPSATWARGNLWTIYATIQGGAGSTLNVICTNTLTAWNYGNIMVENGTLNGGGYAEALNATLDLSGLDYFNAYINHLSVGADGAPGAFYAERPRGTLWLARTNTLVLWSVGTFPSEGTAGGNAGIWAGLIAQNNGSGTNHVSYIHLGLTNGIYCDTGIGLGIRGVSGAIDFNTNNPAGVSSVYLRNKAGTGRQSRWSLGDRTGTASEGQDVLGIMDFSLGTVDAMVGTLSMGNSSVNANRAIGILGFGAGTIDVNTLLLGVQSSSGAGAAQGLITVSNTAVLKVNTSAQIGTLSGSTAGSFPYYAQIIITNGGSVIFSNVAPIACGAAESDIYVDSGSLSVFTVGSANAPLTNLRLSSSTLTVDRGTASNPTTGGLIFVNNLDLSGVNTINILGPVLVKGRFSIIKYGAIVNGGFANLTLGSVSPGIVGYLTNNLANSSIDFVVTSSATTVLVWDGQTNCVNSSSWDIGVTKDWQGVQSYSQASIPGSLVLFDDTATGTTAVTLNGNLAPASLLVTNDAKPYTFSGAGSLVGPTALTKDGANSLTLANTGTNTFSGGVFLNNGTLNNGGNGNTLPSSATVVIQDVATAGINLDNLPLTVGGLSGAGITGGNINLGSAKLTINNGGASYGGIISGSGSLLKTGSGTQTLTGANVFGGGTIVSNGAIVVANASGSGLGSGNVVIAAGSVQLGDGLTANGSIAAPVITNNGALNLLPVSDFMLTNLIVGSGGLSKLIGAGSGTIYITNDNFYTGATSIGLGIIQVSSPHALGSGQINDGNQTVQDTYLALSGGITVTNALSLPAKTGGIIPPVDHIKNVDGTNTLTGSILIAGATVFAIGSDSGDLILTGNLINQQVAIPGRFFLRGAGNGEFRGAFNQGAGSPLELDKWDSGTWTLSSTNTYSAGTFINEGKLIVNGAIFGSSQVTVGFGSALAGTGIIASPITNVGTIFPADDGIMGTLTISNLLVCASGSSVTFDANTNGNDQIRGLTDVTYGGTLKVNVGGTLTGACVFKLFSATNYSGAFDALDLPDISPLGWDTSYLAVDGTLHATNGVVVTPAITHSVMSGGTFQLSGTGTLVAPFTILATTNLATPIINWDIVIPQKTRENHRKQGLFDNSECYGTECGG
jgi:autotransporter-associated beta strand protein